MLYSGITKLKQIMNTQTNSLGLDIGSSSIKLVLMDEHHHIIRQEQAPHFGRIQECLGKMLLTIKADHVLLTGANAAQLVEKSAIMGDITCIHAGMGVMAPAAESVIEIGAQSARYITDLKGETPPRFAVNERCAGGTGSFFEDQMHRLGLPLSRYSSCVAEAGSVPRLSGRCSVFAKTDIIHCQQEGVPTADILLGLCYATVRNLKSSIIKNLPLRKPIALAGGLVQNAGVIRALKDVFELSEDELIVSGELLYAQAAGAAVLAAEQGISWECFTQQLNAAKHSSAPRLAALAANEKSFAHDPSCCPPSHQQDCYLGIDVGSTSINVVLINDAGDLLDFKYLRSQGKAQQVVAEALLSIEQRLGDKVHIKRVGLTGSGRYLMGKFVGADVVKDEITAQGAAALAVDPLADTVFEIGGQDSKYIQLKDGRVCDFQMNKICAAGTGSFIEEQAARLNIPLSQYGELALAATSPVNLGERCTVFIESNITQCLSKGVELPDILAGLCHSVIQNYLVKVVDKKPVGERILLQGGVCYNPAVVAAFQAHFGDSVRVSPYFSISGAYGVALLAAREQSNVPSKFKGFELCAGEQEEIPQPISAIAASTSFVRDPAKKLLGVPRVLSLEKFYPLITQQYEAQGYQVIMSPPSNEDIIAKSQEHAQVESCFSIKLIHGHMAWLAEQKVDAIFMPSLHTTKPSPEGEPKHYGCVFMQSAGKLIFESMKLADKGIALINPRIDFNEASPLLPQKKKPQTRPRPASDESPALVLLTRSYGISDPVLNAGIPDELKARGCRVITMKDLPIDAPEGKFCWSFAQQILAAARYIAQHPNLHAVYLTTHCCGPDGMLSHLVAAEMGNKPYLQIEVDEHASKVGIITRIEAFLNSLQEPQTERIHTPPRYAIKAPSLDEPLFIPNLYPYSQLIQVALNKCGLQVELLPEASEASMQRGRAITTGKEYLSFSAMAGDVLLHAESSPAPAQIWLPLSRGSEADTLYASVIAQYSKARIVGHYWEDIALDEDIAQALQAGDCIMTAPWQEREQLIHAYLNGLSLDELKAQIPARHGDSILLLGEPSLIYQSALNHGLLAEKEREGYHFDWIPLYDYLLALKQPSADAPFIGGNGDYRLRKSKEAKAVIHLSSMDENAQSMLDLSGIKGLSLRLDGTGAHEARQKLDDYLYYIRHDKPSSMPYEEAAERQNA